MLVYASVVALVLCADPRPATFAAGCVVVLLACALRIWAFGHLDKNQAVVTTGPYAHTRNPAYLGSFLALVGVVVACGNAATPRGRVVWGLGLALAIGFFAVYLPRKFRREYGRLERKFGPEARLHAEHVPDFWPRLTPWRSGDTRRFSWRLVAENHELPWLPVLATLLLCAWLVGRWGPLERVLG